ncbi:MAG: hypothetical protein ABJK64_06775 [Paraglaciecola sp.]|uniref:hypothetical protein n=1 Tax=Paraglaciecola sp. TaxID=1920173 RepID=UPI003296FE6C
MNSAKQDQLAVVKKIEKLRLEYLDSAKRVFTLPMILEKLSLSPSPSSFSLIKHLEKTGEINKILRVESPSLGGVGDFESISDIPEVIDDFRTGLELQVRPENIRVLYTLNKDVGS